MKVSDCCLNDCRQWTATIFIFFSCCSPQEGRLPLEVREFAEAQCIVASRTSDFCYSRTWLASSIATMVASKNVSFVNSTFASLFKVETLSWVVLNEKVEDFVRFVANIFGSGRTALRAGCSRKFSLYKSLWSRKCRCIVVFRFGSAVLTSHFSCSPWKPWIELRW